MIELDCCGALTGHSTMYIEEDDPEERAEFATKIDAFIREGHTVFLIKGDSVVRVKGYDPEANDWIVLAAQQAKPKTVRVSARATRATYTARTAGGCYEPLSN